MYLKFIKPFQNFRVDDVGHFAKERIADKIIEAGYAEEVTLESTSLESATVETPKKK
jgi:hypothetical protein